MIFTIPFDQCVSKRDKITKWSRGRVALSDRYRDAKHDAYLTAMVQAREHGWKPIPKEKGVKIMFSIWFPSGNQTDIMNYTEALLDALQGVAYEDDSQCIDVGVYLIGYDKENPQIQIDVFEANRERPLPPSRQPKSRRQPKAQ